MQLTERGGDHAVRQPRLGLAVVRCMRIHNLRLALFSVPHHHLGKESWQGLREPGKSSPHWVPQLDFDG